MPTMRDNILEQARGNLDYLTGLRDTSGGGILGKVGGVLAQYEADLQAMIDRLLKQKGVISDTDYNAYYETLRRTSKKSVEASITRQNIVAGVLILALGVAAYYIWKKR